MITKKIGIIGGGSMGEALLSRLANTVEKSTALMVSEVDAARREYLETRYRMIVEIDNNYVVKYSDVIILAVKPKDFDKVLREEICCGISKNKLLISIAAGVTTRYIESVVGRDIPVIRVMPNLPAVIGEAISSVSGGSAASAEDIELAKEIFRMIGDVVEVKEDLVDAITAVSGSGPAYFFYLIEALTDAAQKLGIEKDIARRLVVKTALGSAKLLESLKEDAGTLRGKVTSKGGTTEAAIGIFEAKKFKEIVACAVNEAYKRSKEIAGGQRCSS